ncbi:hypothetical protein HZA55_05895 [Candidatus Poribacteria bacterium]|nr:hypothetical protein [Candidatus Poribacteria bacterium]
MSKIIMINVQNIKYLFVDMNGVLGSSKIMHGSNNILFCSDIQDGMGVTLALQAGLKVIVVGKSFYPASLKRAKGLKTTEQLLIKNLQKYIIKNKINQNEIAWVANDVISMEHFKNVGFKIATPEAPEGIKKTADLITRKSGGKGALREAVEFIIKQQDKRIICRRGASQTNVLRMTQKIVS